MLILGDVHLPSPLVLAPLAGYSDLPFRLLCREFGASLCFSEMISCHGLVYQQKKTLKMLASVAEEKPVVFQLFGADIAIMAKAADLLNQFSPDFIDINMGCPVKKVTKKGAGAALMTTPDVARNILLEVIKNSDAPVTVKFRKGVNDNKINCIDFARMAEDTGVAAVTVHGRTWAQGFSGLSDWEIISKVKGSVSVPVIGNGDISTYRDAITKMNHSGCDGIMIGRGALGNPWIFSSETQSATPKVILQTVVRHLELMQQHIEVERLLAVVKNHIGRYFKNMKGSSKIRKLVYGSNSFEDLYVKMELLTSKYATLGDDYFDCVFD